MYSKSEKATSEMLQRHNQGRPFILFALLLHAGCAAKSHMSWKIRSSYNTVRTCEQILADNYLQQGLQMKESRVM